MMMLAGKVLKAGGDKNHDRHFFRSVGQWWQGEGNPLLSVR